MTLIWMRHRRSAIAHAFDDTSVMARLDPLEPIVSCDRYPFSDVLRDDLADRCTACLQAARKVEQP